jgi:starvation-inducible outer membrane lipoprotein
LLAGLAKAAASGLMRNMKVTAFLLLLLSLGLSGCIIVIEQAKEKKDAPAQAAKSEAK